MKKILLLTSMIVITSAANAETEYYFSTKLGLGDTTIYVNNDTEFGDYLERAAERNTGLTGFKYDADGLLWELSPAVGVDWTINNSGWFHIRLEGELGYNHYYEEGKLKYGSIVSDTTEIEFSNVFFLVNGYADFRIDKVVPYIGLGLGHGWGKNEITINNYNDSVNTHGALVALHLGVAYKYSDTTTYDLGIRSVDAPVEDDGSYVFTTIRLGARFRI